MPTARTKHVRISPDIDVVPFGQYAAMGWTLEVRCWSCGRTTLYASAEIAERFGADSNTGEVGRRGRCVTDGCGASQPHMRAIVVGDDDGAVTEWRR